MADRKISELTNITGANLADADEFVVVDASADETKAITTGELRTAIGNGDFTVTGDLTVQGTTVTIDSATTQTVDLGDLDKIRLGDGNDLEIYSDGSRGILKSDQSIRILTDLSAGNVGLELYNYNNSGDIVGDEESFIDFVFQDGNNNFTPQARIGAVISGSATDQGGEGTGSLVFLTATGDSVSPYNTGDLSEKFRITHGGDLIAYDTGGSNARLKWDASQQCLTVGDDEAGPHGAVLLYVKAPGEVANNIIRHSGTRVLVEANDAVMQIASDDAGANGSSMILTNGRYHAGVHLVPQAASTGSAGSLIIGHSDLNTQDGNILNDLESDIIIDASGNVGFGMQPGRPIDIMTNNNKVVRIADHPGANDSANDAIITTRPFDVSTDDFVMFLARTTSTQNDLHIGGQNIHNAGIISGEGVQGATDVKIFAYSAVGTESTSSDLPVVHFHHDRAEFHQPVEVNATDAANEVYFRGLASDDANRFLAGIDATDDAYLQLWNASDDMQISFRTDSNVSFIKDSPFVLGNSSRASSDAMFELYSATDEPMIHITNGAQESPPNDHPLCRIMMSDYHDIGGQNVELNYHCLTNDFKIVQAGTTALTITSAGSATFADTLTVNDATVLKSSLCVNKNSADSGYELDVSGSAKIQSQGEVTLWLAGDTDNTGGGPDEADTEAGDARILITQDGNSHEILHIGGNGSATNPNHADLPANSAYILGGDGHSGAIKLHLGVNEVPSVVLKRSTGRTVNGGNSSEGVSLGVNVLDPSGSYDMDVNEHVRIRSTLTLGTDATNVVGGLIIYETGNNYFYTRGVAGESNYIRSTWEGTSSVGTWDLNETYVKVNATNYNADFRVETQTNAYGLFVDADGERVMFGKNSTTSNSDENIYASVDDGSQHFYIASTNRTGLYVNRNTSTGSAVEFRYNNSGVGTISVNSTGTTYATTSDARLKTDIQNLDNATDMLSQMRPVSHKWISDPEGDAVIGFIAQEMKEVVPEAVSEDDTNEKYLSMDYGRITPVLVAALQEANARIEQLEKRLEKLEG